MKCPNCGNPRFKKIEMPKKVEGIGAGKCPKSGCGNVVHYALKTYKPLDVAR